MKFGNEIQRLRILEEYFQPLIDGDKPFEIRKVDSKRIYQKGGKLLLQEIRKEHFEECPLYQNCPYINEVLEEYNGDYGEEEARDICPEHRADCEEHALTFYTGRWCLIQIKKVFSLTKIGLSEYVAFTFEMLETGNGCDLKLTKDTIDYIEFLKRSERYFAEQWYDINDNFCGHCIHNGNCDALGTEDGSEEEIPREKCIEGVLAFARREWEAENDSDRDDRL